MSPRAIGAPVVLLMYCASGCWEDTPAPPTDPHTVVVSGSTTVVVNGVSHVDSNPSFVPSTLLTAADPASRVRVYTSKDIDGEVVGVLDFHTRTDAKDKGFDELRAHAAALGADAVIGAEFEHGDDGGVSHLSGTAVRLRRVPQ